MENRITLLLTGTIDPTVFQNEKQQMNADLQDANQRLKQYDVALTYYLNNTDFTDIVFAENSGYSIDEGKYQKLAQNAGKRFEYLPMLLKSEEIEQMLQRGKSYGEAKLIEGAIHTSKLISQTDTIYKVTGRIILKNANQIIRKSRKGVSEAICWNHHKKFGRNCWIHTEFFKIQKQDYMKAFQGSFSKCNDYVYHHETDTRDCIEQVWYRLAVEQCLTIKCFKTFPNLQGSVGGVSGWKYDRNWLILFVKTILSRCGYFTLKKQDDSQR